MIDGNSDGVRIIYIYEWTKVYIYINITVVAEQKKKKKKKKKLCKRVANKRESYRERFEKKTKMLFNYTYIHVL